MQEYSQPQPHLRMDDPHTVYSQSRDPNGIIMVESNPHGAYKQQQVESAAASNGKKKNKKKNKNKVGGDDASSKSNQMQSMGGNAGSERMVRKIFLIDDFKEFLLKYSHR